MVLRSGQAPELFQPHLMALLDETPLPVVVKAVADGGHNRRAREENHEKPQPVGETMESMQNGLVMAGTPGIPRTWETLFSQALKVIGEIAVFR